MPRRSWRRRTLIIGTTIVILSVGIVFASIPYLPHAHKSIPSSQSYTVNAGSSAYPGYHALALGSMSNGDNWAVGVTANETATFCVIQDSPYENWAESTNRTWAAVPCNDSILKHQRAQTKPTLPASV